MEEIWLSPITKAPKTKGPFYHKNHIYPFRYFQFIKVSGATARWPFTDSAVPSSLLLLFLFLFLFLLRSARLRRQTFMFLFCLLCIIIIFVFLSSAAFPDISINFYAIAFIFGLTIVLDKKNMSFKFQVNRTRGRDRAWSQSLLYFIIGKTLYTMRRDKNFT